MANTGTNICSYTERWYFEGRSSSWRGEGGDVEDRGPRWHERGSTTSSGGGVKRAAWEGGGDDRLPEWATERPVEGGGTFDERGAFHGSEDEVSLIRQ